LTEKLSLIIMNSPEMRGQVLSFDFLEPQRRGSFLVFPLLFFLSLLFPPLLLFIVVIALSIIAFFAKVSIPIIGPAFSHQFNQLYLRSPPFSV